MNNFKISVICELNRFDYPVDVSFQLTRKAYKMVRDFDNAEVQVVIVGKRMSYDNIINDFSLCGADKVIVVELVYGGVARQDVHSVAACKVYEGRFYLGRTAGAVGAIVPGLFRVAHQRGAAVGAEGGEVWPCGVLRPF